MLTTNEFESSVRTVLRNPEIVRLLEDMDQFVIAVNELVRLTDELPEERLAVIDQVMDRVSLEREALFQDISAAPPEFRDALRDLQPVLASIERILEMSRDTDPDAEPFDINDYRLMVEASAITAAELRALNQSITEVMTNSQNLNPLVTALVDAENQVVDHFFQRMVILIVIFFVALIAYRLIVARVVSRRRE